MLVIDLLLKEKNVFLVYVTKEWIIIRFPLFHSSESASVNKFRLMFRGDIS